MDPATIFFLCARSRSSSRATFLRMRKVARDRQWTAAGGEGVSARYGVDRDRQWTTARGGPVLAMESLATTIGCGRRCVEGRGVSVAIDGPYMARRKSGSRGLTYMPSLLSHLPSWPKYKLQMQNHWIPLFVIFGKLQECKVQMQNP